MEKRWNLLPAHEQEAVALQNSLKINEKICSILVQRGLDDFEKARNYFRPSLDQLHDPWLLKDMEKAVSRLEKAIANQEKIMVYGDYDVDGTTSVACMYRFIASLTPNVDFYLPHRYREGYGVSKAGVDHAINNGFTLMISLDCGIKSVELVNYAAENGLDFIICDHHLPDEEVPKAVAILNPKQPDCPYPFKELCGCGVGIKFIQAVCQKQNLPQSNWQNLLDLVATAIAADIVPINGENRILTYFGLKKVNEDPSTGIKALMQLSEQKGEMHVNNMVFVIAPRVNAAGRMDDARKAVQLFLEDDFEKALELAAQLHSDNSDRREADSNITEEALLLIDREAEEMPKKTTVLYQGHWHKGVVGIVASRLVEKYYRPTIILTDSSGKVAGSARSVIGFNVYEAIHQCKDLLESYGGHFYAAGLTMKTENVEAFKSRFESVVANTIEEHMLTPEIVIDTVVSFADITPNFYKIICQMEPFGPQNMRPVFVARNVYETGNSRIVKEAHIKFQLKQGAKIMDGIGFGLAPKFNLLQPNVPLDVVFTLDENEWRDEKKIQLKVIDFRQSDEFNFG
jgi:single-stranded-DNA-specific exonuclease